VPDNQGFFEFGTDGSSYNQRTATYRYVHELTGRPILVDTSFGLSAMADSWSTASPSLLDTRIADGVIAINVATTSAGYQSAIEGLRGQLSGVCE